MRNKIICAMLLTLIISIVPINTVHASEEVEDETVVTENITFGGVSMTRDEFEDFKTRLDSCETEEDVYSLYQSMGMDTSSLDNAFNESSEASESGTEEKTDNKDHADSNIDNTSTAVTGNNEEETDNSVEVTVAPRENNNDNENAGEFSYEYDNSKGVAIIKIVASVIGAIAIGLVGYIAFMRKRKAKK